VRSAPVISGARTSNHSSGRTPIIDREDRVEDATGSAHATLVAHGDWILLGSADEGKPAAEGTVEAWARSGSNPVGGWYGLKQACAAASPLTCPPCSR
jgi:hypothetical protein